MSDSTERTTIHEDEADPSSVPTFVLGVIGTLLIGLVLLVLDTIHRRTNEAETFRKHVAFEAEALLAAEEAQAEPLKSYRWVDQNQGVVAVPIERAMELVVEEANAR